MASEVQRLRLALLEIADGLRDEFADGHLEDFVPINLAARLRVLNNRAWEALGDDLSVADCERIRREGKQ